MLWFISDTHFGHWNMCIYEARPVWMGRHMVYLWNQSIQPTDDVVHLGDFSLCNPLEWIQQLNGNITLIRGSHDWHHKGIQKKHFSKIHNKKCLMHLGGLGEVLLTHKPVEDSPIINLHGHVHGWWKRRGNNINLSVEVWNYRPVNLTELVEFITEGGR